MPESHGQRYAKPQPLGIPRHNATVTVGSMTNTPSDSIVDVVIITSHVCGGCGLPHIMRVSTTAANGETVVAITAMAITDVLIAYEGENTLDELMIYGGNNDH